MSLTPLDALEAAEKEATQGPWSRALASNLEGDGPIIKNLDSFDWVATVQVSNVSEWRENAALIALLRNHAADLIAVARAAESVPELGEDNYLLMGLREALAPLLRERKS